MCIFSVSLFFFFKQKTAYEMRISDWSSDVCSSDLLVVVEGFIERVDTDRVPPLVRKRVAALLAPLVGRDDVTLPMIERRLLRAADTTGATLHSALPAGDRRSGTVLVIEARHRVVTGFATVDNMLPSSPGRHAVGLGPAGHSALGLGEHLHLRPARLPH